MLIEKIAENKREILTGEIGAMLHDIGKCHPDFIGKNSIENLPKDFKHQEIDKILRQELVQYIKNDKLKITINSEKTNIYNLIIEHHNDEHHNKDPEEELVRIFKICDQKDSADDKGIVRKKQSINNVIISSPFGFPKEKIILQCLQTRLDDLQSNLIGLFQNYTSENIEIECFRKSIINNLKTTFSHALGETRIPANDVTLWDHSYSTASLFKTILAGKFCGGYDEAKNASDEKNNKGENNIKWRIFGICWNGIGFIDKGRKVAEIQNRVEVIAEIKKQLKRKFENEIPIGNVIYEDTNGIYFTFPDFNNSNELAGECAKESLEIIYEKSDKEIWPFFTLSKASETLTILTDELKFASETRNIPKMTSTLFIKEGVEDVQKVKISDNPEMPIIEPGRDICPICRLRPKYISDDMPNERCEICDKRRKGRLDDWLNNRENTIWMDEVADKNNRVALLTLNFDLDKWLDGTMVRTIYSQTFEDWLYGKRQGKKTNIKILSALEQNLKPDLNTVYMLLEKYVIKNKNNKEKVLDTFFEENIGLNKNTLDKHISNITEKIKPKEFNKENLATYLFTQNPSPARLYRIWRETEEFFDLVIQEIKSNIYSNKWKRIKFSVDYSKLKSSLKQELKENTTYIIKIENLNPENLLIFHSKNGEFYTIESLEKFEFDRKVGIEAVKKALEDGFFHLSIEDEPDNNLFESGKGDIDKNKINSEDYVPLIEINKSPLSLRVIIPALDSIKIADMVIKLYNQRFEKVLGKLPLNIGLLVAKRKFPLYVLLDSGERMFPNKEFNNSVMMDVWWDINGIRNDKYYGWYPIKMPENLDDLTLLSKGKPYSLYPGYFDFDLLLGTTDRYNIAYKDKKRIGKEYNLFSRRPYYFYQLSQMIDLWEILDNNISSSQINFIEESLTNKLREWSNVDEKREKDVFRKFTEATIKDAFGNKWNKLRKETQDLILNSAFNGILLDTIILFRHTIKGG